MFKFLIPLAVTVTSFGLTAPVSAHAPVLAVAPAAAPASASARYERTFNGITAKIEVVQLGSTLVVLIADFYFGGVPLGRGFTWFDGSRNRLIELQVNGIRHLFSANLNDTWLDVAQGAGIGYAWIL